MELKESTQGAAQEVSFRGVFANALDRAVNAVGVITLLCTVGVFGISALLFGITVGGWIGVTFLGVSGAIELIHSQRKSELFRRLAVPYNGSLMEKLAFSGNVGNIKVIEEVSYGGFLFNGIGFEKLPMVLGISLPLCPKCKRPVVMEARVKFPGRARISYSCLCGYEIVSKMTESELRNHVAKALNQPGSSTQVHDTGRHSDHK